MLAKSDLIKKLIYRSSKCGILENDILLGSFAKDCLHNFPVKSLLEYEALLFEVNDLDLFKWVTCKRLSSDSEQKIILDNIPPHWANSSILKYLQQYALDKSFKY